MTEILCIGSALWDLVGRCSVPLVPGEDRPGRIERWPGGVALNVALALAEARLSPRLLSYVGRDLDGDALVDLMEAQGVDCRAILRRSDLPTDRYMAIEDPSGLVAALADAASLEAVGAEILTPLSAPPTGPVVIDGNLTEEVLLACVAHPHLSGADIRLVPASPGKVLRLACLAGRGVMVYVNRGEAERLCQAPFDGAEAAACALVALGFARALVTDGADLAADACAAQVFTARPPEVAVKRVTGAGDACLAGHLAAELAGADRGAALDAALARAAHHISLEKPLWSP